MIAAEVLEAMRDAGASIDVIIAAVRADAGLAEKADEARRAKDAERQRRHRLSRDVTVTPRDAKDTPPNDIYSNPPVTLDISNEISPPIEIQSKNGLKPEHVVEAWNAMAQRKGLSMVRKLTPDRRKRLAQRIRQNTIDEFTEAIGAIEVSPFLCGENDRSWKADFDFLLSPQKFTKLIEGTYGQ